jgi:hypothetical protein
VGMIYSFLKLQFSKITEVVFLLDEAYAIILSKILATVFL